MKTYEGQGLEQIINENELVLLKFHATWCGPCKMLNKVFKTVAPNHPDVLVYNIDIDHHKDLAIKQQVRGVPTLVMFKNGKEVNRTSCYMPEAKLTQFFNKHK